MPVQKGLYDWEMFRSNIPVWLAGREVNTDLDILFAQLEFAHAATSSVVSSGLGVTVHDAAPSPRAPDQAAHRTSFSLDALQLDEGTARHYRSVAASGAHGLPLIWFPWPTLTTWRIFDGRVTYTTPHEIAGSAGQRTGGYFVPIVEVRTAAGVLVAELTYAAGAPGPTEFSLTSITDDSREIITDGLTAHADLYLHAWAWLLLRVEVLGDFSEGQRSRPGEWHATLELRTAPEPFDYESDA